jgi:hypothetical protein
MTRTSFWEPSKRSGNYFETFVSFVSFVVKNQEREHWHPLKNATHPKQRGARNFIIPQRSVYLTAQAGGRIFGLKVYLKSTAERLYAIG